MGGHLRILWHLDHARPAIAAFIQFDKGRKSHTFYNSHRHTITLLMGHPLTMIVPLVSNAYICKPLTCLGKLKSNRPVTIGGAAQSLLG